MQIVSEGDILHELSTPVFWENNNNISICRLLKKIPSSLCIKLEHFPEIRMKAFSIDVLYNTSLALSFLNSL